MSLSGNAYAEVDGGVSKEVFEMDNNKCYSASHPVAGTAIATSEGKSSSVKDGKKSFQLTIIVLVVVMMSILAAACACRAFTLAEISKLKLETASLQQLKETLNMSLNQFEAHTQEVIERTVIDNDRGSHFIFPGPSCAVLPPFSTSGYYWVRNSIGSAVPVYCDMTRSCGGVTGGWMRVAELDMTDSSQQCPSGLRQHTDGDIRTCVRSSDSAGCSSVTLPTSNHHYSRVCGRIIAYQVGSTDAFFASINDRENISSAYVEGVSLTHGIPRQHIWTFAAAFDRIGDHHEISTYCPCISNNDPPLFYNADPLWDGAGCGSGNTCCTFNTPPWFFKQLLNTTSDDIEMRVCRDEDGDNEDIAISIIEIFVQ